MLTFLLTIVGVFLALGGMGLGVMLGALCGKRRRRLCACAEAKRVASLLAERKKQERAAQFYAPATVNLNQLPVIDPDIA